MGRRVHQVVARATPGDASWLAARCLHSALAGEVAGDVYAASGRLPGGTRALDEHSGRHSEGAGVLVVHTDRSDESDSAALAVAAGVARRPEPVVVVHTARPVGAAPGGAGGSALAALLARAALVLADDEEAAAHALGAGAPAAAVRIVPLTTAAALAARRAEPPDVSTVHHLERSVHGPVMLASGPLAPAARPDVAVAAYHVLVTYLEPEAHLVVAEAPAAAPTAVAHDLQHFVQELGLSRAWLARGASAGALAAFEARADVWVAAGALDPVDALAAMAAGVPVVATATGPAGTIGAGAALVLPGDAGPLLVAEAVAAVLGDAALCSALVAAGRERAAALDAAAVAGEAAALVAEVV